MIARRPGPLRLRPSEALVWEGTPDWRSLARRALHVRVVAAYFVLLQADSVVTVIAERLPVVEAVQAEARLFLLGSVVVAFVLVLAWLMARTTRYTLTSERVVLRYGIGLPATLAIPLGAVEAIALRMNRDGGGDVALRPKRGQHVPYLKLWPNARPWRLSRPEPMLRSLPDAAVLGPMLSRLLADAAQARLAPEPEMAAAD